MKYALIGCGRIATNHMKAAVNNDLEIVAVCDILPEAMENLLKKHELQDSDIKRYTDYKLMLEECKPEFVSIATESGPHAEIALYCIEHGVHVIIEKPMAMNMADADRIIELSREKNVKVAACHQNRFNVAIQELRHAIENDRFGRLSHGSIHVRWNRNKGYYDQAPWRGTWADDGGCLMNQCIHNIDLLRWMMGDEVEEVTAYTDRLLHPYLEAEDLGMAMVKFRNGSYGLIEGTTNVYGKNLEETLYLFGEKGMAKAAGASVNTIEEWRFADGLDDPEEVKKRFSENPPNVYGFGHAPLYADVVDAIRTGRKPLVDAEAGKRALELVLAIYLSAKEHRAVKLPLGNVATTDFSGRFDG